MPKFVFFTDLDGTLLDTSTYSFGGARPALLRIKQTESALVLATSKTKAETLEYEKRLGIWQPSIIENGGAIYIPKGYFWHDLRNADDFGNHFVVRLGARAEELEAVVDGLSEKFGVRAFHEMGVEEIMEETGLTEEQAINAKKKEFIASFKTPDRNVLERVRAFVEGQGYDFAAGTRFCAVMKGNDKGKAVRMLLEDYRKDFESVVSVGLGNAENDFGMLRECDRAFLVAGPDGSYASREFERAGGIGPEGWKRAVMGILKQG